MGTEFASVAEAYACARSAAIRSNVVYHAEFRRLSAKIGRLLSALAEAEDPYWGLLLHFVRRVRFELAAAPAAFNAAELGLVPASIAAKQQYARCATLYPALAPLVADVLAAAHEVLHSADAPLLAGLTTVLEASQDGDAAIVLCEARLIKAVDPVLRSHPTLRGVPVIGPAQLRSLRCYERLVCVGSARWFPAHVTAAPRARVLDFVHFAWTPGPDRPAPLFAVPLGDEKAGAGQWSGAGGDREVARAVVAGDSAPNDDEPWLSTADASAPPGAALLRELVHQARAASATGDRHDLVRALGVALDGGRAVFLDAEDGATVLILDLAERGRNRVRRISTGDVEEGVFVLLRAGGGGDYVVPVANAVLGRRAAECRQQQREWKTRLRAEVQSSGLFETSVALLDLGSNRADENNVRRWMWDRSIRPREYADFLAVMKLIGLESDARRYWDTMTLIDRSHAKAGQLIRGMLLDQVMRSDLAELERLGSMEFDLPGTGTGRMAACRVLRVAREPVRISAAHVGRSMTAGGLSWQS